MSDDGPGRGDGEAAGARPPNASAAEESDGDCAPDTAVVRRVGLGEGSPEGENSAYVIPERSAVIDPGPPTEAAWTALRAGLDAAGLPVEAVERVLVTHWHADHAGLAPRLAAAAGATIRMHREDAPLVADYDAARRRRLARDRRRLREWGVPAETRDSLIGGDDPSPMRADARVEPLDDGDRVAGIEAIHAPGHTRGHVAFALSTGGNGDRETGGTDEASPTPAATLFVGDLLLPTYTPNVGGGDTRLTDPLAAYVESLDRIERRIDATEGDVRLRPGHGRTVASDRIGDVRDHHDERSRRALGALAGEEGDGGNGDESEDRERAETPWAVARSLFGELRGVHAKMGAGEAAAHLERLRRRGAVERVGDDPRRYRPVEGDHREG